MTTKLDVLIVYAHQEPSSFNGALKDVAVKTLKSQGHNVTVSDLYKMNFDPTASKSTIQEPDNEEYFNFQEELKKAASKGKLPSDLQAEIDQVLSSDLVILQFPLYWLGLPAILKGWLDKCFVDQIAFDIQKKKWFDRGPFSQKKIILSFTAGGSESYFSNTGLFGDMNVLLWPIHNALRMTGFQVLSPQILYMLNTTHQDRTAMLEAWEKRLVNIWTEEPLSFVHIDNFTEDDLELSENYLAQIGENDPGPTVGQNLGRSFNPESMLKKNL
ncbi:Flavodoxin-like fold [Mactra antiquata]